MMNYDLRTLNLLEWREGNTWQVGDTPVRHAYASLPALRGGGEAWGVDPGRNFGITMINDSGDIITGWGTLIPQCDPQWLYAPIAYDLMREYLDRNAAENLVVIEGPAFRQAKGGQVYGEANLAYIRGAMMLAVKHMGLNVDISPPATIRKDAFGQGRQKGMDLWPSLNGNAAASVGCALAAWSRLNEGDGN